MKQEAQNNQSLMKKLLCKNNMCMVMILTFVIAILRMVFVSYGPVDLAPDEAHYWEWSRHLDWSYYSKPPMVAWLIALSTSIFDHTHLGVRFFSVIGLAVLSLVAFSVVRRWRGDIAGWIAFALITVTPEFSAGGLLMTPDVPCLVFWALGLYIITKMDWMDLSKSQWKSFIALGVMIGLAGLSKYTAALFYPLLGMFLIVNKDRRAWLMRPQVYVAGIVSLLMMLPVFYWNMQNDWITFKHVMGQAGGSSDFDGLKSIGNFLGSQLGVISPITFLLLLAAWGTSCSATPEERKKKHHLTGAILWWFSAPVFAFFVLKSLDAKVQANWPVLAVFTGLMLLAGWVVLRKKWVKITFGVGLVLSSAIAIIAHDTFMLRYVFGLEFPVRKDPVARDAMGWRGLGELVSSVRDRVSGEPIVITARYQTAGELAFYMRGNPDVLYLNPGYRRQNQYDLWPWPENMKDKMFLYVREEGEIEPEIANGFASCIFLQSVASQLYGVGLKMANVYACGGYKGLERKRPEKY